MGNYGYLARPGPILDGNSWTACEPHGGGDRGIASYLDPSNENFDDVECNHNEGQRRLEATPDALSIRGVAEESDVECIIHPFAWIE